MSSQKKRITPASDASTVEPSPPLLPGQQEFHHYLRCLAQRGCIPVGQHRFLCYDCTGIMKERKEDDMPTQEERIAALEQTTISRIDFLNSVNRLALQQAQNASDTYHEITILLRVTGSQGQDIKTIKENMSTLTGDVSTLKEDVSALKGHLVSLDTKFNEHTMLLTQILARLPEKS